MDPSVRVADGRSDSASKLILDATRKIDSGSFSLPPKPIMMKALEVWRDVGLPRIRHSEARRSAHRALVGGSFGDRNRTRPMQGVT
jgi:hypothetical protein